MSEFDPAKIPILLEHFTEMETELSIRTLDRAIDFHFIPDERIHLNNNNLLEYVDHERYMLVDELKEFIKAHVLL